MEEVLKRTNTDEKYLKLSKGENEIYTLVLETEPAKGVAQNLTLCYRVEDGKIVEVFPTERKPHSKYQHHTGLGWRS